LTRESISHPETTPAAAPPDQARPGPAGAVLDDMIEEAEIAVESPVPDWCNLGLMLRIVVGLNVLFFCVAALSAASLALWLDQWLGVIIVVEPVLIASLFFGCLLRRMAAGLPRWIQFTIPCVLPAILTVIALHLLGPRESDSFSTWRNAVFAGLLAATVLYWARLRELAYSPALAEAQLQALQSRIQPHFLFNSLNAALGLIRSDPRRAETVIEDIADLFRVLMRDSRERVPLTNEIALCKQYLAIEQLRLGDRLTSTWTVEPAAGHALVPTLLLQPLIENAVHHGIEPSVTPGTITIDVSRSGRYIDITIENPWRGKESAEATRGNRIGLDNVKQRLALVHDLEATLESSVRGDRYVVHIRLPAERRRAPREPRPGPSTPAPS
jgi:two-component system sensor histidine kinase AlgZ